MRLVPFLLSYTWGSVHVSAFFLFAVIGVIGLILTEAGMYAGYQVLHVHYLIVKIFVAAIVLVWNYAARKVLIFR